MSTKTELEQIRDERAMEVYKRNDSIQKAKFTLTPTEMKVVLYAASKIKPGDRQFTEYEFDIKKFYQVCGIEKDTYHTLKKNMQKLADKSWFYRQETGEDVLIRWFDDIVLNKGSGKVKIVFHRRMMPFLLQLAEGGEFYTSYRLQYVLPMKSQYSPRLYEVLKSYENNHQWFFEIDTLKQLLDCENYKNFNDFKKRALDPAVEEINQYTDLCIFYTTEKVGRKVVKIHFFLDEKNPDELYETQRSIDEELDQIYIDDIIAEVETSPEQKFWEERRAARKAYEKKEAERKKKFGIKDENDDF